MYFFVAFIWLYNLYGYVYCLSVVRICTQFLNQNFLLTSAIILSRILSFAFLEAINAKFPGQLDNFWKDLNRARGIVSPYSTVVEEWCGSKRRKKVIVKKKQQMRAIKGEILIYVINIFLDDKKIYIINTGSE